MTPLKESSKFKELVNSLNKNNYPLNINGLSDSGKSYVISGIFDEIEESVVVVCSSEMEAKNMYEDLCLYTTNVYFFPIREVVFYNVDAISGDLRWERLKVVKELLNSKKKILCISANPGHPSRRL